MNITTNDGTYEIKFLPFAQPEIIPAIKWGRDSAGLWRGSDRGFQQDVYRSQVTFQADDEAIDHIQGYFNSTQGLGKLHLSAFDAGGQDIFGPYVDYSSGLDVIWDKDYSPRKSVLTNKFSSLDVVLRLVVPQGSPPFRTGEDLGMTLANLHLQSEWDGDTLPTREVKYAYDQSSTFIDNTRRAGEFNGVFSQNSREAGEIIKFLMNRARSAPFLFPISADDVPHPFGAHRTTPSYHPAGQDVQHGFFCVAPEWSVNRVNLNRWEFNIKFCEFPYIA